jgi:hypothetical protein
VPPQYAAIGIQTGAGVRIMLAACLIGTIAHAVGASLLFRSSVRGFDAAVGRRFAPGATPTGTEHQNSIPFCGLIPERKGCLTAPCR